MKFTKEQALRYGHNVLNLKLMEEDLSIPIKVLEDTQLEQERQYNILQANRGSYLVNLQNLINNPHLIPEASRYNIGYINHIQSEIDIYHKSLDEYNKIVN